MYKVTLKEMIAIVNNRAHPYRVTFSVIGDEGTLVAASMETNNVYVTKFCPIVCKGTFYNNKRLVTDEDWQGVPDWGGPSTLYTVGPLVIQVDYYLKDKVEFVYNTQTKRAWNVSKLEVVGA